MFFLIPTLIASICFANVLSRGKRPEARGIERGIELTNVDVPDEFLDEDGLIKSWKGATKQDTDFLKHLVEMGLIQGYSTKAVMKEYTRFKRFTTKCLGDKLSNLKRGWREQEERKRESKWCYI